jgi:hypothetical protein
MGAKDIPPFQGCGWSQVHGAAWEVLLMEELMKPSEQDHYCSCGHPWGKPSDRCQTCGIRMSWWRRLWSCMTCGRRECLKEWYSRKS